MKSPLVRLLALLLAATLIPATSGAGAAPPQDPAGKKADKKSDKKGADASEEKADEWDVSAPPGESKTVTIDTTETTWSDVDVSPDGRTVIFDMLGDIYSVPIEGGDAKALTDGVEWNVQPRFSPDGALIAFISDRKGGDNVWVMNADGSEPRAVSEEKEHIVHNPSWSPDGDYIVAKKDFTSTRSIPGGQIWMFHIGGGGGLQLVDHPDGARAQKNIAEPAFSPDGRYVYYSQDATPGSVWQYNKDSTGQIFVIQRLDREKGETEQFVGGPGGAVRPTPSPDGQTLAFVRRTPGFTSAIFLKDLETGREWPIYDRLDRDLQETDGSQGNATAMAWTRDGGSIVFWAGGKIRRVYVESRRAEEIPVRVKVKKAIQPAVRFPVPVAPPSLDVKMVRWAQVSPDGTTVLLQALGNIYVRELAGGAPRRLTNQDDHFEYYPSFSPDGRQVVYVTWQDQELGSVRIVPVAGGEGRVVTGEPGAYAEPRFSPDGESVVYRKFADGYLLSGQWSMNPGIYVVPAAGGEAVRVSRSGADAHFAGRADRVLFSDSVEETQLALKSVNLDGLEERTHLQGAKVTEFHVSPDGRWVAFTENFNAYVAPFTLTGKTVNVGADGESVPVRQVSKRSGEFLHWSSDSRTLHWANGATLYSRDLKDAFSFLDGAPEELPDPVEEGVSLAFQVPADVPQGRIALVGARILTMRDADKKQEIIDDGVILVNGNRIEAIGPARKVAVPADAFRLDVAGKTIIPGLVDVHAHGAMARDEIIPQQNWAQYSSLAFGVTTIHDPSNDTSSIFAAAEMQRAGLTVGPRIFSTGTILYGAHFPGVTAAIESLEDAKFHVQRLKDVGAISVKSYQQPRRDQRQQVLAAGRELGILVVPEGGAKIQPNMTQIVDGHTGIEHAIPIVTGYEDLLQLWAATAVGYTPTFGVAYGGISGENYWYEHTNVWENERLMRYVPRFAVEPAAMRRSKAPEEHYNHIRVARFAKALRDRGVSVQLGAHGQREGLAAHWELWSMQQGGFTPWEALRAGTIDGARYLGMDGDIGSLEPGKLADLVVIDGDPLQDLRRSEYVDYTMVNGRLFEAATMSQVGNQTSKRQPFFFELEGGDTIHPETRAWIEELGRRHGWSH